MEILFVAFTASSLIFYVAGYFFYWSNRMPIAVAMFSVAVALLFSRIIMQTWWGRI